MIEHIKIEGFKSIKSMEIDLKPINILIGSNGSGKSNFISFFKLLKSIFRHDLQRFILEENADNILYFGRKHTNKLKADLKFTEKNTIYSFILEQNKEGGLYFENEFAESGTPNVVYIPDPNSNMLKLKETQFKFTPFTQYNGLYSSISEIRSFQFDDTTSTSYLRRACDLNDNLYFKPDGRNLPAMLYLIKVKHPKIYSRILKTIQSIAPYIESFILEPNKLKEETIALRWIDKGDLESNFSAYQLSDGTLRFIALATLLMQPEPPAVIIIDEPELGLHPFAIGKLAGMIQTASSESQIIIATQSPSLISHFKPEDVIVVDKSESENQSIFKRLDSESLDIWLEEYSLGDLWERNIINAAQPFEK